MFVVSLTINDGLVVTQKAIDTFNSCIIQEEVALVAIHCLEKEALTSVFRCAALAMC